MLFVGMNIGAAIIEKGMANPQKTKTRISHKLAILLLGIYSRYADDTTLRAENEEELNSLLMRVKEESEKAGLKSTLKKTEIIASSPMCVLMLSCFHCIGLFATLWTIACQAPLSM